MYQNVVIPDMNPGSRLFNKSSYPYSKLDSRFTARSAECPGMTRKGFTSNCHPETLRAAPWRAAVSGSGKQGFTLIELLVVVLIIGILASVALPQYQTAVDKARFSRAQVLVGTIQAAQNAYYLANGEYASAWENLDINVGTPRGEEASYTDVSDGVYCYIGRTSSEYGGCAYSIASGCRALYVTWWQNTSRSSCYASSGCERANKLCKNATGASSFTVVGADNVYRF